MNRIARNTLRGVCALGCGVTAAALLCLFTMSVDARQASDADSEQAKELLDQGVQAYKDGQLDAAAADFRRAKELDPSSTRARLYLATAYASQYIPGAPSEENLAMGRHAIEEYKGVLELDATNLTAIDGLGGILFNVGSNPFDPDTLHESKTYHQRHIELKPEDPVPYYWIGVIDWSICYKTNRNLREEWSKENPNGNLAPADPLPKSVRQDFAEKCVATLDEGIAQARKAIDLQPEYTDALAYLNLLYRLKADTETAPDARDDDIRTAEDLVDRVKAIKEKRAAIPQPN